MSDGLTQRIELVNRRLTEEQAKALPQAVADAVFSVTGRWPDGMMDEEPRDELTPEERAALLHVLNDYMILFVGEWAEQPEMRIRPGPDEDVLASARYKLASVPAPAASSDRETGTG